MLLNKISRLIYLLLVLIVLPYFQVHVTLLNESTSFLNQKFLTSESIHVQTQATILSNEIPAITIFTHGLDGHASDWSNDFGMVDEPSMEFVMDHDSIIERMRANNHNINIYRVKIYENNDLYFFNEYSNGYLPNYRDLQFSQHTIFVLDIKETYNSMEIVYENLHEAIDSINDLYLSSYGKLPLLNLVGHSMGGLLNMQYTIEHPKNVKSLVSIGTPYNGSWYDNWIVENILKIKDFYRQPCITGQCEHSYYFCNLNSRRNSWNTIYQNNSHINFYALCGDMSNGFLINLLSDDSVKDYFNKSTRTNRIIDLNSFQIFNKNEDLLDGDGCVDSDSQLALGYDGVNTYYKYYENGNYNFNKRSRNNVPLIHNLEPYDEDFQNCILGILEYGQNVNINSASGHGIVATIVSKSNNKWLIKLTNNTNGDCHFVYNKRMCFKNDALSWNGLADLISTNLLPNDRSTIIEVYEYLAAPGVVISYEQNYNRYILYFDNLDTSNDKTPNSYLNVVTNSIHYYVISGLKLNIVIKTNGIWFIKITNTLNTKRQIYYNSNMCFYDDARNWSGITDIIQTKELNQNESVVIRIQENGIADSICLMYIDDSTRVVIYANNLNVNGTMAVGNVTHNYHTYINNGIGVAIIGKCSNKWLLELTNCSGELKTLDYNSKMCFENSAKNWSGLKNVVSTIELPNSSSINVEIEENGTAACIAISYVDNSVRKVFYARDLSESGTMTSYSSSTTIHFYSYGAIQIRIIGQNVDTWQLELTNISDVQLTFEYNGKMCFEADAKNWSGLKNIKNVTLESGQTISNPIEISENGTARYITISYLLEDVRYILYAYQLNVDGTMLIFGANKPLQYNTANNISVAIVGKNDKNWKIKLINLLNQSLDIEYNDLMCFENDAKNWSNLENVKSVNVSNGGSCIIQIRENGTAGCIALSYKFGEVRYVVYGKNLNENGTLNLMTNIIDPNAPTEDECVKEGTLITLADGSQKPVEDLTGDEMLLVWNLETGSYDSAPILFIDSDPKGHYEVIKLSFSDGTVVEVISEHGFWDVNLNKYVYLDENASEYIGHSFLKQSNSSMNEVILVDVEVKTEVTTVYSPVTYGHLCYYVNGMLSMPGGIYGMFNIFDIDADTIMYNYDSMQNDIDQYGLFTYEEFNSIVPISEEMFNAVNGQYLKVAIGKGIITIERLQYLANRYCEML